MLWTKGSQGHTCVFRTCTGSRSISRAFDLLLHVRFLFHLSIASGRLRCLVTGVPPQPNSPTDQCLEASDWNADPGLCMGKPTHFVHEAGRGHSPTRVDGADVQRLPIPDHSMSKVTVKVVVFHCWIAPRLALLCVGSGSHMATFSPLLHGNASITGSTDGCDPGGHRGKMALASHLCYTPHVAAQHQTRVKLNRVFFPR